MKLLKALLKTFTPSMSQSEITRTDLLRRMQDPSKPHDVHNPLKKEPWKVETPSNPQWNINDEHEPEANPKENDCNPVEESITKLQTMTVAQKPEAEEEPETEEATKSLRNFAKSLRK